MFSLNRYDDSTFLYVRYLNLYFIKFSFTVMFYEGKYRKTDHYTWIRRNMDGLVTYVAWHNPITMLWFLVVSQFRHPKALMNDVHVEGMNRYQLLQAELKRVDRNKHMLEKYLYRRIYRKILEAQLYIYGKLPGYRNIKGTQ